MSSTTTQNKYHNYPQSKLSGRGRLLLILLVGLFFSFPTEVVGQEPADVVPSYEWVDFEELGEAGLSSSENIVVALDTDSFGTVYTLSFGNGVDKRGVDGELLKEEFISKDDLDSPLDIAVDEEGYIYIADYLDEGDFNQHGKIRVFDPQGNPDRIIPLGFYRPVGIDVDSKNIYIAEYYDGLQGPDQGTEYSRISIYNKQTDIRINNNENDIEKPYRIATDSQGNVYVSQAGNDDPAMLVFDENLNPLPSGDLANVTSPGSVVVDEFDFIHVIDYAGRVDFQVFLSQDIGALLNMLPGIRTGIDQNEFSIKIFDSGANQVGIVQEDNEREIDFPLDFAFNPCSGRMYLNDAYTGTFFLDLTLRFNLEIFDRIPELVDTIAPVISCIGTFPITLAPGESRTITGEELDNGSYDACGEVTFSLSQNVFTTEDEGPNDIILTVRDENNNFSSCPVNVQVNVIENPPTIICPSADEIPPLYLDGNCQYEETDFTYLVTVQHSTNTTAVVQTVTRLNNILTVEMELQEAGSVVDECTFFVNLIDDTPPLINCSPSSVTLSENDEGEFIIPNYSSRVTDNCDESPQVLQDPLPGTKVMVDTPVRITARDDSDNEAVACEFTLILQQEEPDNIAPVAVDDQYSVVEGEILNVEALNGVLKNDSDPDGEQEDLTAILKTDVQNGTLNFNPDGSFTYVPNPGFDGNDVFTYVAKDGELDSNIAIVRIEVTSTDFPNFASFADDDNYTTPYETPLNVEAPGILENDEDDDNPPEDLSSHLVRDVTIGNLALDVDGSFLYIPSPGFSGEVTFTYLVNDGQEDSSPATVTIIVGKLDALQISCPPTQTGELNENCQFQVPDYSSLAEVSDNAAVVTQDPPVGEIVNSGRPVTLTASLGEEVASCTFDLELEGDTTAPLASCVSAYQITLSPVGTGSITAGEINMNSTDNCGEVSLSLDKTNFTTADIGEKIVTLTVTDNSGNTVTCTTVVTVAPYEDPNGDFTCRSRVELQLDETGNAVLTANDLYTGDAGDRTFTISQTNFTCSHLGENQVRLDYTGSEGTSSCTIIVDVKDEIPPVALTNNINMFLGETGRVTLTPSMINAGSIDNCGSLSYSLDKTSLSCKDLGENTVTLTVTDDSGNTASATATVTLTGECDNIPTEPEDDDGYIFIYPNPTPGPFTFATPRGVTMSRVEAFDFRGRFILAKDFLETTSTYEMDITGVEQAVYVLKLFTSEGEKILRVIKN